RFCDAVATLYSSPISKVFINGFISDPFPVLSGVRQGCPLSPGLFSVVIDGLLRSIKRNENIRGLQIPGYGDPFKITAHADDVTIWISHPREIPKIQDVCKIFGQASGAELNNSKSAVLPLGTWTSQRFQSYGMKRV